MKPITFLTSLCATILVGASLPARAAVVQLPAQNAAPPGSGSDPGFNVRVVQGNTSDPLDNSLLRATKQLNGTLVFNGDVVQNEAILGDFTRGAYHVDTLNFELTGLTVLGMPSQLFPGIPGAGGHTKYFAVEAVTWIELEAGQHTFGVSVAADRTDVNDDDSFVVYTSDNPFSTFGTKVGEYERFAAPFSSNQRNTNFFTVSAPVDGLYPFRFVYWQTTRGGNLHLFTVDPDDGQLVLVNDASNPLNSVFAYRSVPVARSIAPYVAEVSPQPGSSGIAPETSIEALLFDGDSPIDDDSIRLLLNGADVIPQFLQRTDDHVVIKYDPSATRPFVVNNVQIEFVDSAGLRCTNAWSFSIVPNNAPKTLVTGQWDFDFCDLRATVGSPLEYFDGPAGETAQKTRFGTTRDFGISDINGQPAMVMCVPGDLKRSIGYIMNHGIPPNGGGTRVNQYTLIMDIFVATSGPGAASLIQISSLGNTDDGDLFWQGNNFGQGTGGYNGTGQFTAGSWHRVVAAYDEAANPPVVTKYVDGIKQDDWTANQGLDNVRRALQAQAILFADGDQDERRVMYVNSIQIRAGKLADSEMVTLGGPDARGIPQTVPTADVAGQWDFDRGDLAATIGKPLEYLGGAAGDTATNTLYGTTDDFGISGIDGQPARVMRSPGDLRRTLGYVMTHGIAPNGGGTRVNQYTLIMDIYVETAGPGAASLWQVSSVANTDDGDLFWQGNNFGQGTGGYNGTGQFTAGSWHRVVAAYDEAANPPVVTKFVDGIKQDDWTANQGLDNPRRALQSQALLFADGDQDERRVMYVNSVQIRPRKLTDAEMAVLGGPSASGIPIVLPGSDVAGQWDFDRGNLAATIGKPLQYFDGTAGQTATGTTFGSTDVLGISGIDGEEAKVMRVPGDLSRNIGYLMTHGISPNGGGTRVNQYTLIMDVFVDTSGPGAASLWQTSSLNNTDDGDLFWQGNNFGQGANGYRGTGIFRAGEWHRMAASYDEAATPPVVVKYLDGIYQDDWTANQGLDNDRRSLAPQAILFADGDQDERRVMYVNAVQIRSRALSKAELSALGPANALGIPIVIPTRPQPKLSFGYCANQMLILWDHSLAGFRLQCSSDLTSGIWEDVDGVTDNSVILDANQPAKFFRLEGR